MHVLLRRITVSIEFGKNWLVNIRLRVSETIPGPRGFVASEFAFRGLRHDSTGWYPLNAWVVYRFEMDVANSQTLLLAWRCLWRVAGSRVSWLRLEILKRNRFAKGTQHLIVSFSVTLAGSCWSHQIWVARWQGVGSHHYFTIPSSPGSVRILISMLTVRIVTRPIRCEILSFMPGSCSAVALNYKRIELAICLDNFLSLASVHLQSLNRVIDGVPNWLALAHVFILLDDLPLTAKEGEVTAFSHLDGILTRTVLVKVV